jgi:penicillin-binding protein 2
MHLGSCVHRYTSPSPISCRVRIMIFKKQYNRRHKDIDPDEIFLDSKNLPNFNQQQFEGRLEKAIPKSSIYFLEIFFVVVALAFIYKVGNLQIRHGEAYFTKSQNNTLSQQPIFADRGLIYDRNGVQLAWNTWNASDPAKFSPPLRSYITDPGFGLLLGYVSSPAVDSAGHYWQDSFIGRDGVEKSYNTDLTGQNGVHITETDVSGKVQSENVVSEPTPGKNVTLSIDAGIQEQMYKSIVAMAENSSFSGGAGVLMDIKTGELLALTSYPEYNPTILSAGQDKATISQYFSDSRKVFLNRALSGLYTPGSIVKPFIGYGALAENVVSPLKQIFANGSISVPNPYVANKPTIFKDHGSFGFVDMEQAIELSSDVYFYEIGGGYQGQPGLGIANIDTYMKDFGIGQKTGIDLGGEKDGIIPSPAWKAKTFNNEPWRLGDTYNTSIGQYGFQVTPIQMVRAVAGIANDGVMPTPHIRLDDTTMNAKTTVIPVNTTDMQVIKEGMRMVVTGGTGRALNLPSVAVAAKSGTAQVGLGNTNTNSWIVGFFPYDNPKYAFAVLMERGPKAASGNATQVMSEVINYMSVYKSSYLQ